MKYKRSCFVSTFYLAKYFLWCQLDYLQPLYSRTIQAHRYKANVFPYLSVSFFFFSLRVRCRYPFSLRSNYLERNGESKYHRIIKSLDLGWKGPQKSLSSNSSVRGRDILRQARLPKASFNLALNTSMDGQLVPVPHTLIMEIFCLIFNILEHTGFARLQQWIIASKRQVLALCIPAEEWDCLSSTCGWVLGSHKQDHLYSLWL